MSTAALIVAAGRGVRTGADIPKQYLSLGSETVLRHSLNRFLGHPSIDHVQVVIASGSEAHYDRSIENLNLPAPVIGGETRQISVLNGLTALNQYAPHNVLIHDAARPFLPVDMLDRIVNKLVDVEAVIPALPVADSLVRSDRKTTAAEVSREHLYRVQTPQAFRFEKILSAHQQASQENFNDDASVFRAAGGKVIVVEGSERAFKITNNEDLERARAMVGMQMEIRVGQGFDVHRFGPGDSVTLCGIDIPHQHSLVGHSDADVALHALTDAILGAIGAGDIGTHFPPEDPQWWGADSAVFLDHAAKAVLGQGGQILNLDLTIICEQPKIGPFREPMRVRLANLLSLDVHRVSVKATTTEGLGFTGRGEGIAAQATVTVELPRQR